MRQQRWSCLPERLSAKGGVSRLCERAHHIQSPERTYLRRLLGGGGQLSAFVIWMHGYGCANPLELLCLRQILFELRPLRGHRSRPHQGCHAWAGPGR
jgi:hypothetical protein